MCPLNAAVEFIKQKHYRIGLERKHVLRVTAEAKSISRCGFVSYKCTLAMKCSHFYAFIVEYLQTEKIERFKTAYVLKHLNQQ